MTNVTGIDLRARQEGSFTPKRRRSRRSSIASTSDSNRPCRSCSTAAGACSSPAWASRASSAARLRRRCRVPARRPSFSIPQDAQHGDFGVLQAEDVIIALSTPARPMRSSVCSRPSSASARVDERLDRRRFGVKDLPGEREIDAGYVGHARAPDTTGGTGIVSRARRRYA